MTKTTGITAKIALRWRKTRSAAKHLLHRWDNLIHNTGSLLSMFSSVGALACIVCLVIHVGYDHTQQGYLTLSRIFRAIQWVFGVTVIFGLTFELKDTVRKSRWLRWTIDIAVLISLLPVIYPRPAHPWIPWLEQILYSNTFLFSVLLAYSIVTLSYSLFRIVDRRTNPSLLLSMSFLVLIILGTFMLMLPKSTHDGIEFADAFFVSTSAVCVTGLTPVDVSAVFTPP